MQLFFRERGQGDRAIIIVHGLYGASDNWLSVAGKLEASFRVILVDQRNHGRSPHSEEHTYEAMANDLLELMQHLGLQRAILMGHSMGGKAVMRFALQYPQMVERLIVVDIAPKSYNSVSNYAQITADHQHIIQSLLQLDLSLFKDRHDISKALQPALPDKNLRSFLLKNLKRNHDGGYHWILNFEALKKNLEAIMNGFSSSQLKAVPTHAQPETIFIKGENSPYIQDEDSLEIHRFFPGAQIVTIPKAHHWVHAEQFDLFVKTVKYFLDI